MDDTARTAAAPTDDAPLVLALCDDLIVATRIEAAARGLGYGSVQVASVASLPSAVGGRWPAAVVLDLTSRAFPLAPTLAALRGEDGALPPMLGFYPHVQPEVGSAAREAGVALAAPRSRFMRELPALLERLVRGDAATTPIGSNDEE